MKNNTTAKLITSIESIQSLVEMATSRNIKISELVVEIESNKKNVDKKILIDKMASYYATMKNAIEKGMETEFEFKTGLQNNIVGIAKNYYESGKSISGTNMGKAITYAMAVSGYNAMMGKVIAAPTAGSCGIMPAVLKICEDNNASEGNVIMSMFTAAGFADMIAEHATFAGAEGGCQAECGAASAMASAAMVEAMGGTQEQCSHAFALTLSTILGLICDPIAGYVEVPCMNKNILGTINAITFAELALAGVKSVVPADEVIIAMKDVGDNMCARFKETSLGGLATTPTGIKISEKLLGKQKHR